VPRIVVLIKYTPDLAARHQFAADGTVDRAAAGGRLSELDEYAAEQALVAADAGGDWQLTYLTMGPADAAEALRKALSMGGDTGVHVLDGALHGSDAIATSLVLATALRKTGFDLVLTGMASTDAGMGVLPAMLAERLGVPQVTLASKLTVDGGEVEIIRDSDVASDTIRAPLPAIVSVTDQSGEARYPSFKGIMAAKRKPVETWDLAELGIDPAEVGLGAARSAVLSVTPRPPRRAGQLVKDDGNGGRELAGFLVGARFI